MTADMTCVASLLDAADDIARELGWPDASLRHAYHGQLMMLLAQAYVQVFGTHPDHPDWVPHTGPLFPWGAPNHDTIYGFAPLDARGLYRVSGNAGHGNGGIAHVPPWRREHGADARCDAG
jgi:hypothetical protein